MDGENLTQSLLTIFGENNVALGKIQAEFGSLKERYDRLETKIDRQVETLTEIKVSLGSLKELKEKMDQLSEDHDEEMVGVHQEIKEINEWRWKAAGALLGLQVVILPVWEFLISPLFR